ncbi:MAG TPA: hypothetical protein VGT41_04120 [Candidatus Babeliales bacterium]|nr:hypothetical protein [Candidatus Babeliales bacterium]
MSVYIPGELIAFATFPGVILHEISHRFFCDIANVKVYDINYFEPLSTKAGHVIHEPTNNFFSVFFISMGPLIINSLVCMILTIPAGSLYYLETEFMGYSPWFMTPAYYVLKWIGYSIGFHAMPSNQDMSNLEKIAQSNSAKVLAAILSGIVAFFNVPYLGFFLKLIFTYGLALILPMIFLG